MFQDLRFILALGTGSSLLGWKVSTATITYRTNEDQGTQKLAPTLKDEQRAWSNTATQRMQLLLPSQFLFI